MKRKVLGSITFLAEYGVMVLICITAKFSSDYIFRFILLYLMIQFLFGHYKIQTNLIWEEAKLLLVSHLCFWITSLLLCKISILDPNIILKNTSITLIMLLFDLILSRYLRIFLRDIFVDHVLIIGTGIQAEALHQVSLSNRFTLTKIIGFIDINDNELFPELSQSIQVSGDIYPVSKIDEILNQMHIEQVIIAIPDINKGYMDYLMTILHNRIKTIKYMPSISGLLTFDSKVEDYDGTLVISTSKGENSLLRSFVKRFLDIIGGILGCLLILPLTAYIKFINTKNGDHGPVFFTQNRIGKDGKKFKMYKYRTMVLNAEQILDDLMEKDPQIKQEYTVNKKLKNDPRITKTGKFLREKSLDEFPQLINVLLGQMTLVGPRPYLPKEIDDMGIYYDSIIGCKPGITGMWQTHGRSDISFQDRCKLDDYYYNNWSIWLDITILIKTLKVVLYGNGAV